MRNMPCVVDGADRPSPPVLSPITQVKAYLRRQWTKILANRVSVQDFVFAKEVR